MSNEQRPTLAISQDPAPVESFVRGLQRALETLDAEQFNQQFAADVLWGSPFGAVADGYDVIHPIHRAMFERHRPADGATPGPVSRYSIEHVRFVADTVAIAYVRRTNPSVTGDPRLGHPNAFNELALFVLIRRGERWWLAAGQHTPDRREVYLR